jgi:hypothetical protein
MDCDGRPTVVRLDAHQYNSSKGHLARFCFEVAPCAKGLFEVLQRSEKLTQRPTFWLQTIRPSQGGVWDFMGENKFLASNLSLLVTLFVVSLHTDVFCAPFFGAPRFIRMRFSVCRVVIGVVR